MKQSKLPFSGAKHIHFVGIKGVGMAPLAIIAKEAGVKVTGCDINEEFITDWALKKAGITPFLGFKKEHVTKSDLVITTGAHGGFDNPEVKHAKYLGIPVMTQGEAVGKFMEGKFGISVAGSHGKTTIAGMLATVLSKNNLDPSWLVGTGNINGDWLPGHYGRGHYFVTEADEYANEPIYDKTSKFLYQKPKLIIITNIEFDHPDMFADIHEVRDAFVKFVIALPKDGVLVCYGDDPQIKKLLKKVDVRAVTYGRGSSNKFILSRVLEARGKTYFWVESKDLKLGEFTLSIPGVHNALNALSVIATCIELGVDIKNIKKTISYFLGTKRRFEFLGELNGALFYDDYAHHPTEIRATLSLARAVFPKKKIIAIFQPHTYSRTKALFNEFVHAFVGADEVIVVDIYPSLREEKDPSVSSQKLVDTMKKIGKKAVSIPIKEDVVQYINQKNLRKNDIVMTMGAGDVYKITEKILSN